LRQRARRVRAAGVDREVGFEPIDGDGEDRIDDAYRTKYADSPYLAPMVAGARPGRDGAGGSAVTVDAGQAQLTLSATTAARDDLPSRMSKAEGPAGACLGRRRHGVTIAAAP
jgi:hypothetical protein